MRQLPGSGNSGPGPNQSIYDSGYNQGLAHVEEAAQDILKGIEFRGLLEVGASSEERAELQGQLLLLATQLADVVGGDVKTEGH